MGEINPNIEELRIYVGKHPWKVAQLLAEAKKVYKTAVKTDNGGKPEDAGTKETKDTETSTKAKRGKKREHKKDEARKNKAQEEEGEGPHAQRRRASRRQAVRGRVKSFEGNRELKRVGPRARVPSGALNPSADWREPGRGRPSVQGA